MDWQINDAITIDFPTHNPFTGQVQDADFLPTCRVFDGDIDIPMLVVAAAQRAGQVGNYRASFVASNANGFVVGRTYNVIADATVAGERGKSRVAMFRLGEDIAAILKPKARFKV